MTKNAMATAKHDRKIIGYARKPIFLMTSPGVSGGGGGSFGAPAVMLGALTEEEATGAEEGCWDGSRVAAPLRSRSKTRKGTNNRIEPRV